MLLESAHGIISEQIARLRELHQSAQERLSKLEVAVRTSERQLDELLVQSRFAAERGLASAEAAAARERQVRSEHDNLAAEYAELRRALRQLDQLVRQIEMSSATLSGAAEDEPADPWVQALRAQIIMGREEERNRLAREVHDGPAQVLANTLMGLERSQTLLADGRHERLGSLLAQMSEVTREGLYEVRGFIADLRPARLEEQGLVGALQEYLRRYHNRVNAAVSFEADPLPRLPAEAEVVLYRVVQESLQNARKHARNAPIHITITVRKKILSLTIRDEGPGFDPREVARRAGRESWGLTSMRERAELIGAHFVVTTRPGHGTEVAIRLPVLVV